MFQNIVICYGEAAIEVKTMAEGILADQFWGEIQENMEEKQQSSKTLFLNTLSDEELLREIHECKIEYKEAEIIIFDGQSGSEKKNFDHNTVA